MIQLGKFKLYLINDSRILQDAGGAFGLVPRALWKDVFMPPTDDNLVPMMQHNLLVQADGRNVIIDTGYGSKMSEKQRAILHFEQPGGGLVGGLARLDLKPEDIDLVIDTHLHNDHCGGNTYHDTNGALQPTFPNAEYVVQRREYQDAARPNERTRATYLSSNFQVLLDSGQMRLLDGDTELAPGITGVVTPGHTPGHMSVRLESEGQHAAFICDLASYAVHFERLGWMTAYDVEPLITLETKRVWQTWALETNALLIFPHDPLRPMGRLTEDANGKRTIQKVDEPYT
ncbi:MAG TPA: MBL fold metallo-hydrolase [Phototrophicaceae bacterium]|nr:MBL fold metallo-hydrolase [Phototrophicaceae bacterium]